MKKIILIIFALLSSTFAFAQKYVDFDNISSEYWPYVNDDNVRVRTYPSTVHSKIITKFSTGEKVNVLEKTVNDKNELWYQVRVNKTYGWMFGEYISFNKDYPSSKVYERKFNKYKTYIETFYDELYETYLNGYPHSYENAACLNKLLSGKRPVSYSSFSSVSNDDGKMYSTDTSIYQIEGCLIEVIEGPSTALGYSWVSSTFTKNVPNTFGVKMGMTLNQLKQIFGPETEESNMLDWNLVKFIFDSNDKLSGIYIYLESGS